MLDQIETKSPLSPNQETESKAVPLIVAERSEDPTTPQDRDLKGQPKNARSTNARGTLSRSTAPKSLTRSNRLSSSERTSVSDTRAKPTEYRATIEYVTRKNVTKSAHLSTLAHSQEEAEAILRQKIMSNGLRQAKRITGFQWNGKLSGTLTKSPTRKRTKSVIKSKSTPKPISRYAGREMAVAVGVTEADSQAPVIKLGFLNIIPAVFAAVAGIGYGIGFGIAKGMFSKN